MNTEAEHRRRGEARSEVVDLRVKHALEALAAQGVTGGPKDQAVSVRMEGTLLAAARAITGIESDSELLRAALASLVAGDDFGSWLLTQSGALPADFALEL